MVIELNYIFKKGKIQITRNLWLGERMKKLGRKFWIAMVLFGLIGQVAWTVENMYLNVFIY